MITEPVSPAGTKPAIPGTRASNIRKYSLLRAEIIKIVETTLAATLADSVQKKTFGSLSFLDTYYGEVKSQTSKSFVWAVVVASFGLALFALTIVSLMLTLGNSQVIAIVGVIAGALAEVIAGIIFVHYGKSNTQLAIIHQNLEQALRFLLANSICETLEDRDKQLARRALITAIAQANGAP